MKPKYNLILTIIGIIIVIAILFLVKYYTKTYSVTFDTKGGTIYQTVEVKPGDKVDLPDDPVMEGYKFVGWYCNGEPYDSNTEINEDTTIVAHWLEIQTKTISEN